ICLHNFGNVVTCCSGTHYQTLSTRSPEEGPQEPPEDIGIVIEGVTVSQELSSVASACAPPLGLMSVLYLAFPKHLQFSFEVLQEIFMPFEQQEMSPKIWATFTCKKHVFLQNQSLWL
uniref:Uncharacterized protein n=1 Tax=Astyanax mexicanus TaxID=7994 RepID=A0A8B9RG86_ASTMX